MYVRLWRKADIWQTSDVGEEPTVDIGCRLNGAAGSVQHADFPRMDREPRGEIRSGFQRLIDANDFKVHLTCITAAKWRSRKA